MVRYGGLSFKSICAGMPASGSYVNLGGWVCEIVIANWQVKWRREYVHTRRLPATKVTRFEMKLAVDDRHDAGLIADTKMQQPAIGFRRH